MFEAFITGYSFYILLAIYITAMYIFIEHARSFGLSFAATLGFIIYLIGLYYNSSFSVFEWLSTHWIHILVGLVSYLFIGLCWSYFKWYRFVTNTSDLYLKHREAYTKSAIDNTIDVSRVTREFYSKYQISLPIKVSDYRYKILSWMAAWPFTLTFSLLRDPIDYIYRKFYEFSQRIYNKIIDNAFDSVKSDFETKNK